MSRPQRQYWYRLLTGTAAILGICWSNSNAMETKLSMTIWNRYTVEMSEGEITDNYFSVERGYFRLEPKFTGTIKGRFNLDFFSDTKGMYPDGVGVKLKYAYVDFSGMSKYVPDTRLSVGLVKNYFGMIYDYDYTIIQKALEDKEGVAPSTDFGAVLSGYLPKGFGEAAVGIYNGEGYKKSGSAVNTSPALAANLRFIPFAGITVGGSFSHEANRHAVRIVAAPGDTVTDEIAATNIAAVGRLVKGMFDVWFEYLMVPANHDSLAARAGFTVMPVIKLGKHLPLDLDAVGRYDQWDGDTGTDNDGHSRITAGLNWNIERSGKGSPAVRAQLNWERTQYQDSSRDPADAVLMQVQWNFSNTLN